MAEIHFEDTRRLMLVKLLQYMLALTFETPDGLPKKINKINIAEMEKSFAWFETSPDFESLCDIIGLEPDYVFETAKKKLIAVQNSGRFDYRAHFVKRMQKWNTARTRDRGAVK